MNWKSLWCSVAAELPPVVAEERVQDKSSTHPWRGTAVSNSHKLCGYSSDHWQSLRSRDEPTVLSGVPEAGPPSGIPAGDRCWPSVCRSPACSLARERSWMKATHPYSTETELFECTSEFFGRPAPRLRAEAYRFSYRHCEHEPERRVREFLRTVMWVLRLVCLSPGAQVFRYSSVHLSH